MASGLSTTPTYVHVLSISEQLKGNLLGSVGSFVPRLNPIILTNMPESETLKLSESLKVFDEDTLAGNKLAVTHCTHALVFFYVITVKAASVSNSPNGLCPSVQ